MEWSAKPKARPANGGLETRLLRKLFRAQRKFASYGSFSALPRYIFGINNCVRAPGPEINGCLPIPNTEVKPHYADGTRRVTSR